MITAKKHKSSNIAIIITIAVFAALIVFTTIMLNNAAATSSEEALKAVHDNIIRAVISCYAYEGFYPDSIDYLRDNYNLKIDSNKYLIFYDKIADNLMPNIIVTPRR
jgi:flagellar basal body-associated protein FliL